MARERYLIGVDPEELKESHQPAPPMTPRQKWQKFWYLHRVAVIVGVCVVALAVIFGVMLGTREKVDYTLVLVTQGVINDTARAELADDLAACGEDLDGDGHVNVRVLALNMSDPGDYVELSTVFSGGTAVFFAMEPTYYQTQIEALETDDQHYFTTLDVTAPGMAENGRYWNWSGSPEQEIMSGSMPQELYFGVRLPIGTASGSKNEQASADCTALLQRFIEEKGIA